MKISELKKDAKLKLSGKWGLAIGINLVYLVITLLLSYVTTKIEGIVGSILSLIVSVISIPLAYGLTASMLKLSRSEAVTITDFITVGLKNFKRAIFLSLSIFIRIIIPVILIAVAVTLTIMSSFMGSDAGALAIVSLILAVVGMVWVFYKVLAYALSTYLLVDNPEAISKEVIHKSNELMKGNKLKFVGLVLSFFGWFLLCGFVGGIATIVNNTFGTIVTYVTSLILTPYVTFTEINFYEDLAGIAGVTTETTTTETPIE